MDRNEKIGLIGGIGGATLGATLWLVILGIAIKSVFLVVLPVIIGSICVYASLRIYNIRPDRKFSIIGLAVIWLVFWNTLLCNFYFDRIPKSVGAISTGKDQIALAQVNVMFAVFFLIGCGLILKEILNKRS